jgi:hypothetical protein
MLPAVVLLVLIGLSHILKTQSHRTPWRIATLTGIALGLAIYTYTSSFALHIAFALFFIAYALLNHAQFRQHLRALLVVGILGLVLTLPMVYIRLTDPQGSNRAGSIATPLHEAQAGNPQLLIDNAIKLAGMPAFVGDPTWRYNVPSRPLFLLPIGLLVYIGIGIALFNLRRHPINTMLLGLLLVGLIPSLLTVLAPSFLRSIVTLPSLMIFVGLTIDQTRKHLPNKLTWGIISVIIGLTAIADYHAYFVTWATDATMTLPYHDNREQGEPLFEIYRDDLEQLKHYLSQRDESIAFVSTPNEELDPLIYKYTGQASDTKIVFFNAFANIVLSEEPTLLFISPLSPISEKHQNWLTPDYGTQHIDTLYRQDHNIAYEVYRVSDAPNSLTQALSDIDQRTVFIQSDGQRQAINFPVNFGNQIQLRNIEIPRETVYNKDDGVNNQLYLEPLIEPSGATLSIFMHLIAEDGQPPVAQRDLLGIKPANWHPNILFIQDNFVPIQMPIEPRRYTLTMGVYDIQTGQRLPILDAQGNILADHLILGEIDVIVRPEE